MADFYPALTVRYSENVGFELFWWRRECPVYHPYLLVCYVTKYTLGVPHRWREALGVGRDVGVIMDSGGFQLEAGKSVNPLDVLSWQLANAVDGDIIVPLDFPYPSTLIDDSEIEKRAKFTAKNTEEWIKAVDKAGVRVTVAVPLHGFTEKHIRLWYGYLKDYIASTQSIALGSLVINMKMSAEVASAIATRVRYAIDYVKHVHIFGLVGRSVAPYILLLEDMLKKVNVTFDSSAFSKSLKSYRVLVPFDLAKRMTLGRYAKCRHMKIPPDKLPQITCHCPACMKFYGGKLGQSATVKMGGYTNHILLLHNLFHYLLFIDKLKVLRLVGKLEEYYAKNFKSGAKILEVTRAILGGERLRLQDTNLLRWLY